MRTARGKAFRLRREHAPALQADAIVGVRFAATEVSPGLTEVLCDGSAVVVTADAAVTHAIHEALQRPSGLPPRSDRTLTSSRCKARRLASQVCASRLACTRTTR
jgi:hypothetical protein